MPRMVYRAKNKSGTDKSEKVESPMKNCGFHSLRARLFCAALTLVLLSGLTSAFAAEQSGHYTYAQLADADTSATPAGFGTSAYDGYVWTDKSVAANGADGFTVTLSALSQEYVKTDVTSQTAGKAADVLLILDVTGSMKRNINNDSTASSASTSRAGYMVQAANRSIDIIMNANDKNRILVLAFTSNSNASQAATTELLPLAHYTASTAGQYLSINSSYKISTSFNTKTVTVANGTCTQYGITDAVTKLISEKGSTAQQETLPYVLLLTDGAAAGASTNWYGTTSQLGSNYNYNNDGTAQNTALTILTAAYQRKLLEAAYKQYNSGTDVDVTWFNIGLSVNNADNLAKTLLEPAYVADTANTGTQAKAVRAQIATYASGSYSSYGGAGSSAGYIYADRYIYYAQDQATLEEAFTDLGMLVAEATKEVTTAITASSANAYDATNSLVFADTLGAGMALDGAPKLGSVAGTVKSSAGGVTVYQFTGFTSYAEYNSATRTLTWTIPAKDLPIVTFKDRKTLNSASGYDNPGALSLTYAARLQTEAVGTYYSNDTVSLAGAQFTPAGDNPSYYTLSGSTYTPKAALETVAKSANTTGTSANVRATAWSGTKAVVTLGNNGKLTLAAKIYAVSYTGSAGSTSVSLPYGETYTLDYNDGITGSQTATVDGDKTIPDPTRDGYTFGGWVYDSTAKTFTAQWTAIHYAITYTLEGGQVTPSNPTTYTKETDGFTLQNPTKAGYTFAGWTGTGLTGSSTSVTIPKGSTGDRGYSATWTANPIAITYDADGKDDENTETLSTDDKIKVDPNGGNWSGSTAAQTITLASDVTLADPTRTGYTFLGWAVTDGSGDIKKVFTAQWAQNITVSGVVYLNNNHSGGNIDTTPAVTVTLRGSDGSTRTVSVSSLSTAWNYDSAAHTGQASFSFADLDPTLTYQVETDASGYIDTYYAPDASIGTESSVPVSAEAKTAGSTDYGTDVKLTYTPGSFIMDFSVDASAITNSSVRPRSVNLKITTWYNASDFTTNGRQSGTQHEWSALTQFTGATVYNVALDGNSGIGTGSFPVWIEDAHDADDGTDAAGFTPYSYRLQVVSYVLPDGTTVVAADTEGTQGDVYKWTQTVTGGVAPATKTGASGIVTILPGVYAASASATSQTGTVVAKITASTYTLAYDVNGGTAIPNESGAVDLPDTLPTPTKTVGGNSSIFLGWYYDANCTVPAAAGAAIRDIDSQYVDSTTSTITLHAKWSDPSDITGNVRIHFGNSYVTIPLAARAKSNLVTLYRSEDSGATWTAVDSRTVTYAAADVSTLATTESTSPDFTFPAQPTSSADGSKAYVYSIGVSMTNYDVKYFASAANRDGATQTGASADKKAGSYYAELTFDPAQAKASVLIDDSALSSAVKPTSYKYKVLYNEAVPGGNAPGNFAGIIGQNSGVAWSASGNTSTDTQDAIWYYTFVNTPYYYQAMLVDSAADTTAKDLKGIDVAYSNGVYWDGTAWKGGSSDNGTMTLTLTPKKYTVTLNADGGTIQSGAITEYTYGVGATLPVNVTKPYATFGGWYLDAALTTPATDIGNTETGAKTYYAKWTPISVGVEYDSDGDSSTPAAVQPVNQGQNIGIDPNGGTYNSSSNPQVVAINATGTYAIGNAARQSYSFLGWDVSGKAANWKNSNYDCAYVFTAKWGAEISFHKDGLGSQDSAILQTGTTLIIDPNGGSWIPVTGATANADGTYSLDVSKAAFIADPTLNANLFNGWEVSANANGDTILTAKWVKKIAPTITTSAVAEGTAGTAYSQQLEATGTKPITWAIVSGMLPPGLSLDPATGVISGTPAATGTYPFTVTASNDPTLSDAKSFSITVRQASARIKPPKTGDASMVWLWIALLVLGAGGIVSILFIARKKQKK